MTKAQQQALATWQALPAQHATCLTVIYRADQAAEAEQRGAWTTGGRTEKASVWRWRPYRPVRTPPADSLAAQLRAHGLNHAAALAAFTALDDHGLIEVRPCGTQGRDIKLTTAGRKVARAGGVDPAHTGTKDLLSEGLWEMLVSVWQAHPDAYPASDSGAWDRLLHADPNPLVRVADTPYRLDQYRLRRAMLLTDAGADHYRRNWHTYARAYPDVNAPHPDAATVAWPPHVDETLARLRHQCQQLRDLITALPAAADALSSPAAAPPPPIELPHLPPAGTAPADLASSLERLHRAARHTQAAIDRATARYNGAIRDALTGYAAVLADHTADAHTPYRDACLHYAHTAAAVLDAAVTGHDPDRALRTQPPADADWPWAPPPSPATGLPDLDAKLRTAHQAATPPRRRTTGDPDLLTTAALLTDYADTLTTLLADGHLLRLLLRRAPATEQS
ncbi:hypothetical protein [Actinomadura fibrosa]|uniref:MarR family transcriptional regulator n=1 Tax=Actinomadura fibrosa TaxID=111802 RepID=A0ABW2XJ92_9ACTN|nr:hypothetical protein [Actinomadura fibrosa]